MPTRVVTMFLLLVPTRDTVFDATGPAGYLPGPQMSAVPAVPNLHLKADSVTIQLENLHVG